MPIFIKLRNRLGLIPVKKSWAISKSDNDF